MNRQAREQEIKRYIRAMRYQPRTRENRMIIVGLIINLRELRNEKVAA